MTVPGSPACLGRLDQPPCSRYRGDRKCEAFPKKIPASIWWEGDAHRREVQGDHGLRYKAAK